MTSELITIALANVVFVAPALSQTAALPLIPELTAPPNAIFRSGGANSPDSLATDRYYRLATNMSTALIVDHYVAQLVAQGWSVAFRHVQTMLGVVRFSAGSTVDPLVGTLTVLPFDSSGQTVVTVRLAGGRGNLRPGGGGANARYGLTVSFGLVEQRQLLLPTGVLWAGGYGGGGGPDHMLAQMRLKTAMAPTEVMTHLQTQLPQRGWKVDGLAGDALLSVVRRSTSPAPDKSELWMLTSLPNAGEIDMVLIVIASNR